MGHWGTVRQDLPRMAKEAWCNEETWTWLSHPPGLWVLGLHLTITAVLSSHTTLFSFKALLLTHLHRQEWNYTDVSLDYYCSNLGQVPFSGIHLFLVAKTRFHLNSSLPPQLSALSYRSHEGIFYHLDGGSSENFSSLLWEASLPQELFLLLEFGTAVWT